MPPLRMQARPLASDPIVEPVPLFRGRRVAGGADSRGSRPLLPIRSRPTDSELIPATPSCARGWRAARSLSLARSTVGLTLQRAASAGLRSPPPSALTDRVLEAML